MTPWSVSHSLCLYSSISRRTKGLRRKRRTGLSFSVPPVRVQEDPSLGGPEWRPRGTPIWGSHRLQAERGPSGPLREVTNYDGPTGVTNQEETCSTEEKEKSTTNFHYGSSMLIYPIHTVLSHVLPGSSTPSVVERGQETDLRKVF